MKINRYHLASFLSILFALFSFISNKIASNTNVALLDILSVTYVIAYIVLLFLTKSLFVNEYKLKNVALLFDIFILLFLSERTVILILANLQSFIPYSLYLSYLYTFITVIGYIVGLMIYYKVLKIKELLVKIIAILNLFIGAELLLERIVTMYMYYTGNPYIVSEQFSQFRYWAILSSEFLYAIGFLLLGYVFLEHSKNRRGFIYGLVKKFFPK